MEEQGNTLLFSCVVGSQAYGTAVPTSDIDMKHVYIQPLVDILGNKYNAQFSSGKDVEFYEIKRFLELVSIANPTMLELLYAPSETIQHCHPAFQRVIDARDKFLTKKCRNSFGGYAVQQIQKAKGLDKKMNWEKGRVTRKTPIDFVYVYDRGKTVPILKWMQDEGRNMKQEFCGLVALEHFKDCYALYYDFVAQYGADSNRPTVELGYRGLAVEEGNHLRLSAVPKYVEPETVVYYNKDGYSVHCKEYRQYEEWLENRNTQRYVDTKTHGQMVDGKSLAHCRRLLDTALEIAIEGVVNVRRPNAEYLLQIRRGEVNLEEIIAQAEKDIVKMDEAFEKSSLPKDVNPEFVNQLLVDIRREVYGL